MMTNPQAQAELDVLLGTDSHPTSRIGIDQIRENPFQPRKTFDLEDLAKLRDSIREYGVLQPVVVRADGDGFQLIAGERRLRAAKEAGLAEIPVQVVDFNDQQVNEAALVENIQRADLNPIEKASGFKDYLERFTLTQEQLAGRLGMDRTTISNLLGLLNLPDEVQEWVRTGQLTLGHAKVLKGVPGADRQTSLAKDVIARSLSVHALEALVKQQKAEAAGQDSPPAPKTTKAEKTAHVQALETEIQQALAVKVAIKLKTKEKGQITLQFDSNDDFERIVERLRM